MKKSLQRIVLLLVIVLMSPASKTAALPDPLSGTLKRVRETGTLWVGYRTDAIPFSFLDDKRKVVGYSYDYIDKISNALKKILHMSAIDIKHIPITAQNRFLMLQNGVIDIECGVTSNNSERRKLFAFSNTLFINTNRIMTRKDANITNFNNLKGKTVVAKANTTGEAMLARLNADQNYHMRIISSHERDVPPLMLLQAGQAEAYVHLDAILSAMVADSWRPQEWIITGEAQTREASSCLLNKNDHAFKQVVDDAIAQTMTSGQAMALYKKWFMAPIPPKNHTLNFPISDAMIRLFKNPNDEGFD